MEEIKERTHSNGHRRTADSDGQEPEVGTGPCTLHYQLEGTGQARPGTEGNKNWQLTPQSGRQTHTHTHPHTHPSLIPAYTWRKNREMMVPRGCAVSLLCNCNGASQLKTFQPPLSGRLRWPSFGLRPGQRRISMTLRALSIPRYIYNICMCMSPMVLPLE